MNPSRLELVDDIDNSDDNKNEEDDDDVEEDDTHNDDDDDYDENDYLSPVSIESEEANYMC